MDVDGLKVLSFVGYWLEIILSFEKLFIVICYVNFFIIFVCFKLIEVVFVLEFLNMMLCFIM